MRKYERPITGGNGVENYRHARLLSHSRGPRWLQKMIYSRIQRMYASSVWRLDINGLTGWSYFCIVTMRLCANKNYARLTGGII
jgi:hypothetical protein